MRVAFVVMLLWAGVVAGCGGQAGVGAARRGEASPPVEGRDAGLDAAGPEPGRPPPPPDVPEPLPEPFEDPGCPPAVEAPALRECEPMSVPSGCAEGEGCFPFVSYPTGPCGVEQYGTRCRTAGSGTQGDPCDREPCAAEHLCVSTGRGTQCVRMCSFGADAPATCGPGLLCLPIDIEGVGGCL